MIQFDETTHTYTKDNNPYISVTTLIKQFGLSPDYSGIPKEILEKAAARGNATHKDLENFIKQGTTTNNPDLINFSKYVAIRNINLTTAKSEQIVYDDQYLIAGTVDFQYFDGDDDIIADFKTTSSIHWDAVSWQLSLYAYMICQGDILQYYMKHLKVFHMYNGKFTVRDVPTIDYDEVVKLLTAHITNTSYVYVPNVSAIISDSESVVLSTLLDEIAQCEALLNDLNRKKDEMKKKLQTNMEAQNKHHFSIKDIEVVYSEPASRKSLDTDKVKQLCASHNVDINDMYKVSTTKPRLIIKKGSLRM